LCLSTTIRRKRGWFFFPTRDRRMDNIMHRVYGSEREASSGAL
jgi:hypothetical protein